MFYFVNLVSKIERRKKNLYKNRLESIYLAEDKKTSIYCGSKLRRFKEINFNMVFVS